MVQNDTAPPISFNIKNSDGSNKNLTGATVRFKIKGPAGTLTNNAHNECAIVDAVAGNVRYAFLAGDIATEGEYSCDLEVTDSLGKVQTEYDMTVLVVRAENG